MELKRSHLGKDLDAVQNEAEKQKDDDAMKKKKWNSYKSVKSVICNSVALLNVGEATCISSISKIQRREMPWLRII